MAEGVSVQEFRFSVWGYGLRLSGYRVWGIGRRVYGIVVRVKGWAILGLGLSG